MNELTRDGVRLAHVRAGSGDPPLLFVHGWCCDHTHFAPQFQHFSARHEVVAIDQRGFGESDKPEAPYTIEGFASDVAWIIGELGLDRPIVIGHSLGGAVALATAANHAESVRGAVLCDPAVVTPAAINAGSSASVAALAGADYAAFARKFVSDQLFISTDDPERKARIIDQMTSNPQHVMHGAFAGLWAFDSEDAAARCQVPLLNIDAAAPIPDTARFRKLCPHLMTAQTAGAGHFHQLEVPEQVNAMIEQFLRVAF